MSDQGAKRTLHYLNIVPVALGERRRIRPPQR